MALLRITNVASEGKGLELLLFPGRAKKTEEKIFLFLLLCGAFWGNSPVFSQIPDSFLLVPQSEKPENSKSGRLGTDAAGEKRMFFRVLVGSDVFVYFAHLSLPPPLRR